MLQAGRVQQDKQVEVLVGLVETHKRAETEALLQSLEILPRRRMKHRGIDLEEFDLNAALARHPQLILVDELAHTNAPGSRHSKRWQDIQELLQAGINVYTTLNVQHVESLNDVVTAITGVQVRETVPDSVLAEADEIALIDLPVNELLDRMNAGKVYFSEQAQRAKQSFFRPGNLSALRELALRRTAESVDVQMLAYRKGHSIDNTWPVSERILVAVGPSPNSANLVRSASRSAQRLNAQWIAAFVETPGYARYPEQTRQRILSTIQLAEELGAQTVTLTANNAGQALIEYARARNVTRIIAGKSIQPSWKRFFQQTLTQELIEESGTIQVDLIAPVTGAVEPSAPQVAALSSPIPKSELLFSVAVLVAATIVAFLLRPFLAATNLAMIYLLGAVAISVRCSRRVSTVAAFLLVASFDFFCVPPYGDFAVSDTEYLITFAAMLTVSLIIADLTARGREQISQIASREARTQILYLLSKRLAREEESLPIATEAARLIEDGFPAKAIIFLPGMENQVSFNRRTSYQLPLPQAEESIAQWVYDHNQKAGHGLATLSGSKALYFPLAARQNVRGVLALLPTHDNVPFSVEEHNLLDTLCQQVGLALERAATQQTMRTSELEIETERLRNSLLSAVSHDLRTPLASITGAATTLQQQSGRLDTGTQNDLLTSIVEEAERLSRLVNNLLDMTRLEAGGMVPHLDWHPFEEIIGSALRRLKNILKDHPVKVTIADNLPLLYVDAVLFEQVLVNLLENAARYTPSATPIEINARTSADTMQIQIADHGPGFPAENEKRVFEKFYRGPDSTGRGSGLGLAICRAIVDAHHGEIEAENSNGALVRIRLPQPTHPPIITEPADA